MESTAKNVENTSSGYSEYKMKDEDIEYYQRIYLLFLWLTGFALFVLSLIDIIAFSVLLTLDYVVVTFFRSKYFNCGMTFLFVGIILAFCTAILICSIKETKRKTVFTIFIVDFLALASVITSILLLNQFLGKLNENLFNKNIYKSIKQNYYDIKGQENWKKIHLDYKCCGVENLGKLMRKNNYTLDFIIEIRKRHVHDAKFESDENVKQFAQLNFCHQINLTFHRSCGDTVLSIMENKTTLLKMFGELLLPVLILTIILIFFGYFLIKKPKTSVWDIYR